MKKGLVIGIIIGLILGIFIGFMTLYKPSVNNSFKTTEKYSGIIMGMCGSYIDRIDENTKKLEFEVNGNDGLMGGANGISDSQCKYYMGKNFGGEGVYAPGLEFYSCRLQNVWRDKSDRELLRGNCVCYYNEKLTA